TSPPPCRSRYACALRSSRWLEQVQCVPGWIFDGQGTTERLVPRWAGDLDAVRTHGLVRGVGILHEPPELDGLISLFGAERQSGSVGRAELNEIRALDLHG